MNTVPDSVIAAVDQMKAGLLTSEALVQSCLDRIAETDGAIQAWAHLDPEQALAQAREADRRRQAGRPLGPLHGIPVGCKDIYDTADMPTEFGTPVHQGRQPVGDATTIAKLREAGAVIMGKTVTAEFAFLTPGKTANPHDAGRTPGGSSSGSAAAVAAGQVPLAVGSQTNGSVVRPASFCGTFGLKPSRGSISRAGVLQTSETLDQLGVFARNLEDTALLADVLTGVDPADPGAHARPKPVLLEGCREEVPAPPAFACFALPYDDRINDDCRGLADELRAALGGQVEDLPMADLFPGIIEYHRIIHWYELRRNLARQYAEHRGQLSPFLADLLGKAEDISDGQYAEAQAAMAQAEAFFAEFFNDFDAILTPSAAGEAPLGLDATGDPIFCTIWTFAGLPCLSLPLGSGANGMPIGMQLVGAAEEDDRLCRTAKWLLAHLADV